MLNAFLHRSYILSTEKHLRDNSKFFWTYINSKRNSNGLPSYMYYLDKGSTNSILIRDLFADYFQSFYAVDTVILKSSFQLDKILTIFNVDLSLADVEAALSSLDSKTSFDSDVIVDIVLNKCYLHLSRPLFLLFKKSSSSGVFLDRWKIPKLVPIHKSG